MASNLIDLIANSDGLQPNSNGLHPIKVVGVIFLLSLLMKADSHAQPACGRLFALWYVD